MGRARLTDMWSVAGVARPAAKPDLFIATFDPEGRVSVRQPACDLGWYPGASLGLVVTAGVLRLRALSESNADAGALYGVQLDDRFRVLIPFGIRMLNGLVAGTKVIILTNPADGVLATLPVMRVVAQFMGGP